MTEVAWYWEAAIGTTNLSQFLEKSSQKPFLLSPEIVPSRKSEYAYITTFPFDPAWCHNAMISGSHRLLIKRFTWESSYLVQTKVLHLAQGHTTSRTRCWTPPPVTDVIWRCLRGIAWPQKPQERKRRWHHSTLEWHKSFYQLQWSFWGCTSY